MFLIRLLLPLVVRQHLVASNIGYEMQTLDSVAMSFSVPRRANFDPKKQGLEVGADRERACSSSLPLLLRGKGAPLTQRGGGETRNALPAAAAAAAAGSHTEPQERGGRAERVRPLLVNSTRGGTMVALGVPF
ncbi:unnamed protein product [Lampetra fluviatilis]